MIIIEKDYLKEKTSGRSSNLVGLWSGGINSDILAFVQAIKK
jgi:hypothetical protein